MINIELTPQEAELFMSFRKNQDTFNVLLQAGVFDIRNGKAILNFDSTGNLEEIKFDIMRYKRGKPILVIHT